jgi:hypothetical protein
MVLRHHQARIKAARLLEAFRNDSGALFRIGAGRCTLKK